MKRILLIILAVFLSVACSGQAKNEIKDIIYCTASSARWVSVFEIKSDSLFLFKKRGTFTIDAKQYKITSQENKEQFNIIYVEKEFPAVKVPKGVTLNRPQSSANVEYNAFVIYFSNDRQKMFLLTITGHYKSVDEVKNTVNTLDITSRYFTNWYSTEVFDNFLKYSELTDADKTTVQKVVDYWTNDLKENKIHNTLNIPYQENLSKALIANHLNPLGTMTDLDNKIKEYQISLPVVH